MSVHAVVALRTREMAQGKSCQIAVFNDRRRSVRLLFRRVLSSLEFVLPSAVHH